MATEAQQPVIDQDRPPEGPPRPRRRRWLLRVGVGALVFLLLVVIGTQIVLWTALPKSILVAQVEKGMGLRMAVDRLSTGWLGYTTMRDVKIALPLSENAFFDVPEMKVHHTGLIPLIFGWDVQIKEVELRKPVLYVRQNAAGKWNLQEVAELLARAGGKKTGDQTAQTSTTPVLPQLNIVEMTVVVIDNQNRQTRIEPINVSGAPDTPVAWKYDVEILSQGKNVPPHLSLLGRVAPGALWQHEAQIWLRDIVPWVRPWVPSFNQPVAFHGTWAGSLEAKGLRGFLQIKDSTFGNYHLDGALGAAQNGSVFSINPDNLNLSQTDPAQPSSAPKRFAITMPRGTIDYDGKVVKATQVQLALLGGPATFNGWYEPDLNQGAIEAYWQNLVVPQAGTTQSGKLNLTYVRPIAAPLRIQLTASSSGTAQKSPFDAVVKLAVTGEQFNDLTWEISTPQLAYYRPPQPVLLNGLSASGTFHQDAEHAVVKLERLSLPADNRLAGNASYDLTTKEAKLHVEGQDWPLHLVEGVKVGFVVDADSKTVALKADPKKLVQFVNLSQCTLRTGEASLSLTGTYDAREPKPVSACVTFANKPGAETQTGQPAIVRGYILGTANLSGTLDPRALAIDGSLEGRSAEVLGHPIGNVTTKLAGSVDNEKATIRADGIPFLDGIWNLGATYVTEHEDNPVYATTIDFSVDRLPLPKVSEFLNLPAVNGTFAGHWYVNFPGLNPDLPQIGITGSGKIQKFAASYLVADEVNFTTTLKDSVFKVDPIRLTHGNYGRIDAHAEVALDQWRQVKAGLNFTAFPVDIAPDAVGLQLWGGSSAINIYLPDAKSKDPGTRQLRVNTEMNIRTAVALNNQPEGEVRVTAGMQGRIFDVREIAGDILGGSVSGNAVADIDHLFTQSKAKFAWKDLQSDRVVRLYPQLKGLGGAFSGSAILQPASVPRPLEPLALDIYSQAAKGHWRTVEIGNAEIHTYLGPHRLIASDLKASTLYLSKGSIDVWFASNGHIDTVPTPNGPEKAVGITVSNQLNLTLRALDIDQFVSAFDAGHKPGFGRLGGQLFLLSAPSTRTLAATASATTAPSTSLAATTQAAAQRQEDTLQHILRSTTLDGIVNIERSDLGNFGPIAFLYNAMHLGGGVRTPTGHGNVSFHMEQGMLHISNLYFFNKGIEVRGVTTVQQMWKFPDSPLDGAVTGTARPLKSIKLPLFAEADALITALQGSLTSVLFGGTVRNPGQYQLASLAQLGGELRGILLGEIGQGQ